MYFGETLNDYIHETHQNPYGRRKLRIPRPEFYVIYTGTDKKQVNMLYTLADEFSGGNDSFNNVKVKVLQGDDDETSIVTQYVKFTQILAEEEKTYGRNPKAIQETIKICKERNILKKFFEENEQEVVNIMATLYKDEELSKAYERDLEIHTIISAYRDAKIPEVQIKNYLMQRFELTEEDAEDYMAPIPA